MNIIKWIKLQFYIPQINKAEKKVIGHRYFARCLEEKPREKRSNKEQSTIEYNYAMAEVWQKELEKLEFKIERIKNN
jgi:hypothetical protein